MHPQVRANYLASPMLVVAFALAGRVDIDLTREPLGKGKDGQPVFLRDIWPTSAEVARRDGGLAQAGAVRAAIRLGVRGRRDLAGAVGTGGEPIRLGSDEHLRRRSRPSSRTCRTEPGPLKDIAGARVLAVLGDSVTTDHISPAGSIPKNGPAARYLLEHGVQQADWNTFGARRGQSRGDDARNVRQRAHQERPRPRQGGQLDGPSSHRRGHVDLRRGRCDTGRRAPRSSSWRARSTGPGRAGTGPRKGRRC